jgi:hypothetical protein
MDRQEFFLLIPAIIYGVAIIDLLKVFYHEKNYIEVVGWGIFIMMAVIFAWIELFNKLQAITSNNLSFFLIIGQAMFYAKIASLITPEAKDVDTKAYFMSIRKTLFLLISAIALYGIFLQYFLYKDSTPDWVRAIAIVIFLITAYSNKYWVRLSMLGIALTISILRIFTDVLR